MKNIFENAEDIIGKVVTDVRIFAGLVAVHSEEGVFLTIDGGVVPKEDVVLYLTVKGRISLGLNTKEQEALEAKENRRKQFEKLQEEFGNEETT